MFQYFEEKYSVSTSCDCHNWFQSPVTFTLIKLTLKINADTQNKGNCLLALPHFQGREMVPFYCLHYGMSS